jgi:hypothetical protein
MDYNNRKRLNDFKTTMETRVGDIVRLRKVHPCGSYEWEVVSVGPDIGLKCLKCHRRVLLTEDVFRRRVKKFVSRSD